MKRAVLTGATGFVGFALLNELIKNDYFVYVLCREGSKRQKRLEGLKNIGVIEADISAVYELPQAAGADIFLHLAWEGGRDDFDAQTKNIGMTINCMRLAKRLNIPRFLCTGSQAEYGETTKLITEEKAENPATSYGAAKVATYYLARDFAKQAGISLVWARLFSVYGLHDNDNSLIPNVLRSLRDTGTARLNTDGTQIWNYLHEEDAARALRLLEESGAEGVFNVASRKSMPLRDYMEEISDKIGFGAEKSGVNLNVSTNKLRAAIGKWEMHEFSSMDWERWD